MFDKSLHNGTFFALPINWRDYHLMEGSCLLGLPRCLMTGVILLNTISNGRRGLNNFVALKTNWINNV